MYSKRSRSLVARTALLPAAQSLAGAPLYTAVGAQRVTSATVIFEQLHAAIVALRLLPGTALQEKALAEQFGVSRTPVREALIRLAEAGLVDIFPQSGTFVSRIPLSAIPEAVIVREALEGVTVEMAAKLATAADLQRLEAVIGRQTAFASIGDTSAFHDVDEAFHETIAAVSGHPGIWRVVRPAKVQIDRARRLTLPVPGRMHHVINEHKVILDAIARHDPVEARAAMMEHLSEVIVDIRELVGTNPDYFV
jgi:DNA-binding GntR family transcriptional regulator